MKTLFFTLLAAFGAATVSFAQGPGGVSANLKAWYKANVGVTGSAPVTQWNNQSATVGINATAVNGPTLLNYNINFNPALSFDGTNDIMQVASGLFGTSTVNDAFVYIISTARDGAGTGRTAFGETVSGERFQAHIPWGSEVYWDFGACCGTGRVNTLTGWGGTNDKFYLWTLGSSTGTGTPSGLRKSIYRDALLIASNNSSDGVTGSNQAFFLGGRAGGEFTYGSIAEVIIYTGVPSNTDLQKIHSYLAIKYGLTLDQSTPQDYVSSAGATIYDADGSTTAVGYVNDIAGIARDDNAALSQKRSLSSTGNDPVIIANGVATGNVFANDNSSVVWGNDGSTVTSTGVAPPPGYLSKTLRNWKVDALGTLGTMSVRFLLNNGIMNSGIPGDYGLAVDTDTNFTSGATIYPTATISGDTLTFTGVTFPVGFRFFTLGLNIAPRPYPGGVAGNYLAWYKTDKEVTGVAPVTAWGDQSIRNKDASAVSGPTFVNPSINFNASLLFNGSSNFMSVTGGLLGSSSYNNAFVYFVAQTNVVSASNLFFENLAGGKRLGSHVPWTDFNVYYDFGLCCASGRVSGNWGAAAGEFNYWSLGSSTSTATPSTTRKYIYRNNNLAAANNNSDNATGANQDFTMGSAGAGNFYNGNITELFISTNVPTVTELSQIHSYLSVKYGMHKPGNYLASDASIIWNSTTNSTYHNDVTGIGRDDNSDLLQKQSKSYNSDDIVTIGVGTALTTTNALNIGSFSSDKSYLIWGNNNGSNLANGGVDVPATIVTRLQRAWKVGESGATPPATVRIRFETSSFPGANDLNDVRLVVDADGTFASGAGTIVAPAFVNNPGKIVEFNHDFVAGTGYFFTLGSVNLATAPLPIQLLTFTAVAEKNIVQLAWSTETETRNDFFTIERSSENINWQAVKTVKGAGNSDKRIDYADVDARPINGISYYRLKQTDFDKTSTYSKIIKVEFKAVDEYLNVYPNPTNGTATLEIPSSVDLEKVELVTTMGVTLNTISSAADNGKLAIDVSSLPKGIYVLKVAGRNGYNRSVRLVFN
ncbi:hypothetical protein BH09BAC3_BH09BAC3_32820 [soil metagenome]